MSERNLETPGAMTGRPVAGIVESGAPARDRRLARGGGRGVAAVVDLGDLHPARAVADRGAADPRPGVGAPRGVDAGRRAAGPALGARRARHAVGRRQLERAPAWPRLVPQAPGHSAAARAVPPLRPRPLGGPRIPGLRAGAAGRLVGPGAHSRPARGAAGRGRGAGQGLHPAERDFRDLRLRALRAGS